MWLFNYLIIYLIILLFDYLNQEANDFTDEIEDAEYNIVDGKLLFIGDNKEKFNFKAFSMLSIFLSNIYNGKISLKEAEFEQKNRRSTKIWLWTKK